MHMSSHITLYKTGAKCVFRERFGFAGGGGGGGGGAEGGILFN